MGLDMFLTKRAYIGAKWEHNEVEANISIKKKGKEIVIDVSKLESIAQEVMYWRKDNHIHKWFVDNCQDGEDDCRDAYVSKKDIESLVQLCKEVIANKDKASELLPTQSGFFFGDTRYDDYYFESLQATIDVLEKELKETDFSVWYFYYSSSW